MKDQIVREIKENWRKACYKFQKFVTDSYPPIYVGSDINKLKEDISYALILMDSKDANMKLAVGVFWKNFVSSKRYSNKFDEAKKSIEDAFSLFGHRGILYIDLITKNNPDVLDKLHSILIKYKDCEYY